MNKIKIPFWLRKNILAIYSPKKCIIPESKTRTIDTEIIINLPQNSTAFLTTKFKGQKIKELKGPLKKRLRITLLNESYFHKYIVEKGDIIGYLLWPDSTISIQKYEKKKKHKIPANYLSQTWDWKNFWKKERRRQTVGFLNSYDFAYTGRDTVNQVGKIALNIIKGAVGNINEIAKERIDQIIKTEGAEVECIAQK